MYLLERGFFTAQHFAHLRTTAHANYPGDLRRDVLRPILPLRRRGREAGEESNGGCEAYRPRNVVGGDRGHIRRSPVAPVCVRDAEPADQTFQDPVPVTA